MDTIAKAQALFEYTRNVRRQIHRHPELGFDEFQTAQKVASELMSLGMEVTTGVGRTGVVGVLSGRRDGPVILLRFDMDALSIQEENTCEYASEVPGVMHACGHDGHVAVGLSVARLLYSCRAELAGTIKFVFQPAEEGLGGAQAMISDGVLVSPKPDIALGLHLWNVKPLGWLGISPGAVMAAGDHLKIKVTGKGGHAALPHLTVDPVLAAAALINAMQSIVARNVSPLKTAVVSVTSIHGGEAFNIIPSRVELEGTIRTFEEATRQIVLQRLDQVCRGISQVMGCQVELDVQSLTPPLINDPGLAEKLRKLAAGLFPAFNIETDYRTVVSEDMAFMMQEIPGCYFFVGSANPAKNLDAAHHNPRFDFDEQALVTAIALMTSMVLELGKA